MIAFGIFLIIAGGAGIFSMFDAPVLIHPGTQILAAVIMIAFGVVLIYLKSTEDERRDERRKEAEKRKVVKQRVDGQQRFRNSTIFQTVLRDLQSQRWAALHHPLGCQIMLDRVILPYHEYLYKAYGFDRLDETGCAQFAQYLRTQYSGACTVEPITDSGYDGGAVYVVGYRLIVRPVEPPLKKW